MMKPIELEITSPVEQLHYPLFDQKDVRVFIKRDDLIHPLISGNKWRKLKYPLISAQLENKTHLVTFGGAFSNHLLATAAAAAKFGFRSTGIVRGDEADNDILFLCRLHGMQLIFTDRNSYRNKQKLFEQYFGNDDGAFFINEGGASAEGASGCSELVNELPRLYDHLFCACGTGTTAAGILNGLTDNNLSTTLHAVAVLKNGDFLRDDIRRYLKHDTQYELHTGYHFGGYAKVTSQLIAFIKDFVATTGVLIEPVYTGKMLYALFDLIKKDFFKKGSTILAIHTGGIWGLTGMKDKFEIK